MTVMLEFSMFPTDKGESLSHYVARSLEVIQNSAVAYRLNPMGTVLEGEWDDVMKVVKDCYDKMSQECNRVSCSIKIDARKGKGNRLTEKIKSIEAKLDQPVNQ